MELHLQQSLAQAYVCAGRVSKKGFPKTESWQLGAIAIFAFAS